MSIFKKEEEEAKNQADETGDPALSQAMFYSWGQKPEVQGARDANTALYQYVAWIVEDHFQPQLLDAIDDFGNWAMGQDAEMFNNPGFLNELGGNFWGQITAVCGGPDTPIAQYLQSEYGSRVDEAMRSGRENSFIFWLKEIAKEMCLDLKQNTSFILRRDWSALEKKATAESDLYIGMLHELGLPKVNFQKGDFSKNMQQCAERYREKNGAAKVDNKKDQEQLAQQEAFREAQNKTQLV